MSIHGLVNMKRTKKDRKNSDHAISSDEDFPFGLSISLDDESLAKLGIKTLPEVGEEMIVAGVGKVQSVSERSEANRKSRNVTIQLEQLEVGPLKADTKPQTAEDAVSAAIKDV